MEKTNTNVEISRLLEYGLQRGLIAPEDKAYAANRMLALLGLREFEPQPVEEELHTPVEPLERLCQFAAEAGLIEPDTRDGRDQFDTELMNCLMPRPSQVVREFYSLYEKDKQAATDYYYQLARSSNYIRVDRIEKDRMWTAPTPYGDLVITINLSKPEKDPKAIAAAKNAPQSGYPKCADIPGAVEYYKQAQQLAREKKYSEAQELLEDMCLSDYTQSYLPLADLKLELQHPQGDVENYRRSLSLEDAISRLTYTIGGTTYTREAFVSAPDQAIVLRIQADKPGSITLKAWFDCRLRSSCTIEDGRLVLDGVAPSQVDPSYLGETPNPIAYEEDPQKKGMRFCAILEAQAQGGTIHPWEDALEITGADSVTLLVAAQTSFNGPFRQPYLDGKPYKELCLKDLNAAAAQSFEALRQRHMEDYKSYFDRVSMNLGPDEDEVPTMERLARWNEDVDPQRYALLYQYGRYLIISGSRPGTQPTNLQGIWNKHLRAAWSSNFTININTEMNYWPVETANLSELHQPLLQFLHDTLRVTGAHTALTHYGARGFVAHHNTDIWGLSNPVGNHGRGTGSYAYWPLSAGWLCSHAFEHYLFTQDKDFLRETGYPIIRDAGRFFLDVLIENAEGKLIFSPSTSPENVFIYNGKRCSVAETTTMTMAIVRETLENLAACCQILDTAPDLAKEVHAALERLPQFKIGSRGELLEWNEELEEAEPEHRHTSHLYTLYPAHLISTDGTPELANACRRTLELRGDESTGWALVWRISLWAHLHDGEHAYQVLKKQLRPIDGSLPQYSLSGGGSYPNMFGGHPPFQIDSNYGACAGIAELFLQSWDGNIDLLPAVPKALGTGTIRGLRARGGVTVDLDFRDGKLEQAVLTRTAAGQEAFTLRYAGKEKAVTLAQGQPLTVAGSEF